MPKRTVIDCYKELPEAHMVPDSVWTCYSARQSVDELKTALLEATIALNVAADTMLRDLRINWSQDEIDATGIMDCI
jgi:hypothetical protein